MANVKQQGLLRQQLAHQH